MHRNGVAPSSLAAAKKAWMTSLSTRKSQINPTRSPALTPPTFIAARAPSKTSKDWKNAEDIACTLLQSGEAKLVRPVHDVNLRGQREKGLYFEQKNLPNRYCRDSRCYATPDSTDEPLSTSTILPVTPPFPSNSCACLASARGNRCAMSGLIFCC